MWITYSLEGSDWYIRRNNTTRHLCRLFIWMGRVDILLEFLVYIIYTWTLYQCYGGNGKWCWKSIPTPFAEYQARALCECSRCRRDSLWVGGVFTANVTLILNSLFAVVAALGNVLVFVGLIILQRVSVFVSADIWRRSSLFQTDSIFFMGEASPSLFHGYCRHCWPMDCGCFLWGQYGLFLNAPGAIISNYD